MGLVINMTTDNSQFQPGITLVNSILTKDANRALNAIGVYRTGMQNKDNGAQYVQWISLPANLTSVQQALINHLGIEPRAMAIKRMTMSRTQRAVLIMQAMEIAVKRKYNL